MEKMCPNQPFLLDCSLCSKAPGEGSWKLEDAIFQCQNGDIICPECYNILEYCPKCNKKLLKTEMGEGLRNRFAEEHIKRAAEGNVGSETSLQIFSVPLKNPPNSDDEVINTTRNK